VLPPASGSKRVEAVPRLEHRMTQRVLDEGSEAREFLKRALQARDRARWLVEPVVQHPESDYGGAFFHPHEAHVDIGRDIATHNRD
jgi:hypothetical protein